MFRVRRCIRVGWPLVAVLAMTSLALAVFLALAEDVWEKQAFPFDATILDYFHRLATPTLTTIMLGITTTGSFPFMVGALIAISVLFWWRQRHMDVVALLASVGGGALLNEILKAIFARPRPALYPALVQTVGYSFPSGHSTTALAFYGIMAYLLGRQLAWPRRYLLYAFAVLWMLLVGLSRNYLGAHYPSDVIAAYAVTFPWLVAVIFVHSCLTERPAAGDRSTETAAGVGLPPPE